MSQIGIDKMMTKETKSLFASLRKRLFDRDYSPAFQDEYQRLWHEASVECDRLRLQLKRLGWKRYMVDDDATEDAKLTGHYQDALDALKADE